MDQTGGLIAGHHEASIRGVGHSFAFILLTLRLILNRKSYCIKISCGTGCRTSSTPFICRIPLQGGAVQGIGWALNEEYVYGEDGCLQNAAFLDYRIPVASDLPNIDTIIIEVPNPDHPFGVRGVGETGIAPPLPALANAVYAAAGVRLRSLPMCPSKVLRAIKTGEDGC